MIKIGQIHSHLGEGVYSMIHTSCVADDKTEFLVNRRAACPVNFNHTTGLVGCPWCHENVALSVILENYKNSSDKEDDTTPVVVDTWSEDSKEEQK